MVKMQRVPGPKDPAELTYYTLYNGKPLLGTAAAKILSTIDSQRMALTLHHVVLLQADRKGIVFPFITCNTIKCFLQITVMPQANINDPDLNIFVLEKILKSVSYFLCCLKL